MGTRTHTIRDISRTLELERLGLAGSRELEQACARHAVEVAEILRDAANRSAKMRLGLIEKPAARR